MDKKKLYLMVYCALLTALTLVATMIIRIPSFASIGYVNLGDTLVLLCAWLIGGGYGAFAAGAGSALADLIGGYGYYVPGTFTIKFLMALCAWFIVKSLKNKRLSKTAVRVFSGIAAEVIMVCGYFLYKAFILGRYESALLSIPSNIVQGITCLIIAVILMSVLERSNALKSFLSIRNKD